MAKKSYTRKKQYRARVQDQQKQGKLNDALGPFRQPRDNDGSMARDTNR